MSQRSDVPDRPVDVPPEAFPSALAGGRTVLVACPGSPQRYAIGLRALADQATADDTGILVTTTESASRTVETYDDLSPDAQRPALKVVDTSSPDQSLSAVYDEIPVIFTPSPGDLERLTVALSDLTDVDRSPTGEQHLVVRSLTPILETTPTDRVGTVLDRITGLRTGGGLCLLGIDYTAHDEATLQTIAAHTDGVLWVTRPADGTVEVDYEPATGRYGQP